MHPSDAACGVSTEWSMRYSDSSKKMEFCDGTNWELVGIPPDSAPSPFSFGDQTDVGISATIESNTVTLGGFDGTLSASCSSPCIGIKRNNDAWGGTSVEGFTIGDTITIRLTSSATVNTEEAVTVYVGDTSDVWNVTTTALIGLSCKDLLDNGFSVDKAYWIDPDGVGGGPAFQTYCDMTNGGWTKVMRGYGGSTTGWQDATVAVGTPELVELGNTTWKYSDSIINSIRGTGIYRAISDISASAITGGPYSYTRFWPNVTYNHSVDATGVAAISYSDSACVTDPLGADNNDYWNGLGDGSSGSHTLYFLPSRNWVWWWQAGKRGGSSADWCYGTTVGCSFSLWVK